MAKHQQKRKRGRPPKPPSETGAPITLYVSRDAAAMIRARGGSRYVVELVINDGRSISAE